MRMPEGQPEPALPLSLMKLYTIAQLYNSTFNLLQ
jgi:hypothetical protein